MDGSQEPEERAPHETEPNLRFSNTAIALGGAAFVLLTAEAFLRLNDTSLLEPVGWLFD